MSIASFWCPRCGAGYHEHEGHECKAVWRVVAPDGREWSSPRLMAAVSDAIEETKLQFPAPQNEEDFRRRPASSEAAPSADSSGGAK